MEGGRGKSSKSKASLSRAALSAFFSLLVTLVLQSGTRLISLRDKETEAQGSQSPLLWGSRWHRGQLHPASLTAEPSLLTTLASSATDGTPSILSSPGGERKGAQCFWGLILFRHQGLWLVGENLGNKADDGCKGTSPSLAGTFLVGAFVS